MASEADAQLVMTGVSSQPRATEPRRRGVSWLAAMLVAVALSGVFVYLPWEALSDQGFPDRDNNLDSIDVMLRNGAKLFDLEGADVLALALNEYLWREILLLVGQFSYDTSAGFTLVSLAAAALVTFHVVRRAGISYGVPFLLAPLVVDLFLSQTRSALALGIFMGAIAVRRHAWLRYLLFAVAFMVHSFAAVLSAIYLVNSFLISQARVPARVKLLGTMFLGLCASAIWAFLANYLFTLVGDRRATQDEIMPSSVTFAVWWVLISAMLVLFARVNGRDGEGHYVMLAVTLLSMFVFTTVFGAGGLRFLSLSLPLVFIAISSIREPVLRSATIAGTIAFNLFHTLLWAS